jgi:hypothetical protein
VFDALSGSESRENGGFFVLVAWRNKDGDWFPDYFISGVPEDSFCAFVPTGDDAVERFADDGVVGGLDERGEPIRRELRTLQVSDFVARQTII